MRTITKDILTLLAIQIRQEGKKKDYGMGHVVHELLWNGHIYEVALCDFGNGRDVYRDGVKIGNI